MQRGLQERTGVELAAVVTFFMHLARQLERVVRNEVPQPEVSDGEVRAWYEANKDSLPEFPPAPGKRAPRRAKGRAVGLPPG